MSSASQDEKPPASDPVKEDLDKETSSPGRYSLADEVDAVPITRVDSTSRMPAVTASMAKNEKRRAPPLPARSAVLGRAIPAPPKPKLANRAEAMLGAPALPEPARVPSAASASMQTPSSESARRAPSIPIPSDARTKTEEMPALSEAMVADAMAARAEKVKSVPPPSTKASRRPSSLRPPPPAAMDLGISLVPSSAPTFELDEGSIMFAFDALVSDGPSGQEGKQTFDLTPVRELFAELAANHMRHVRDFMIDVKWGEVTRDWVNICLPPVRTLRRAAERLELAELDVALNKLAEELDAANASGGQMLDEAEKKRLLDTYGELVTILPQAFALDRDKTQREAVIVQALLLQVPDVRKVTIDKMHAAGLTSLTALFASNPHDIAEVAGIPDTLAAKIVERVQSYREELKSASPQDARAAERDKLAALNGTLKEHHVAYEEAQNAWGPDAKARKRQHYRAREETWLEISVLLARFGEVDRLQGIEKVPFSQRIAQLTDYLEEAREKYRAEGP